MSQPRQDHTRISYNTLHCLDLYPFDGEDPYPIFSSNHQRVTMIALPNQNINTIITELAIATLMLGGKPTLVVIYEDKHEIAVKMFFAERLSRFDIDVRLVPLTPNQYSRYVDNGVLGDRLLRDYVLGLYPDLVHDFGTLGITEDDLFDQHPKPGPGTFQDRSAGISNNVNTTYQRPPANSEIEVIPVMGRPDIYFTQDYPIQLYLYLDPNTLYIYAFAKATNGGVSRLSPDEADDAAAFGFRIPTPELATDLRRRLGP